MHVQRRTRTFRKTVSSNNQLVDFGLESGLKGTGPDKIRYLSFLSSVVASGVSDGVMALSLYCCCCLCCYCCCVHIGCVAAVLGGLGFCCVCRVGVVGYFVSVGVCLG